MPAQALLVPHDFVDRRQYLHARRTLTRLLELGAVPIVNENDAIASDETRYGDNDRIAALVAHNIGAGVLVLLTDLDGLYTADPRVDADADARRRACAADDPLLAIRAGAGGSGRGSGGMASKLEAARIASWSGVRTVIARRRAAGRAGRGDRRRAGRHDVRGPPPQAAGAQAVDRLRRRTSPGTVTVDDGARRALVERQTSLLPAGVVDVVGPLRRGRHRRRHRHRRRRVRPRHGVRRGRRSCAASPAATPATCPPGMAHEVIHRDDLVLLPG